MIFGNTSDFAIEAHREPFASGGVWGRMCVYIEGVRIGDIDERHCELFPAAARFRRLCPDIEEMWDDSLAGLDDAEIFSLIDRALYTGDEGKWERYGRFDFLTNGGEQFDGEKTFVICRPGKRVRILYRLRDDRVGSGSCHSEAFRAAASSFLAWFDDQREEACVDSVSTPEKGKNNDYWALLKSTATTATEKTHRHIACAFCRLVWSALPEEGKQALVVAEKYAEGTIDIETCERHQKLLQQMLPGGGQSVPISAVIWALEESSAGYPAWYSAALAGTNLVELNAATEEQLCSIVRKFVLEERPT